MLAALLLAIISCEPDLINYTPTPTLGWDAVHADATHGEPDGYSLYVSEGGGPFQRLADLPCWSGEDGFVYCSLGAPVQRHCPLCEEYALYDFAVTAYNAYGESASLSNTVSICMPHIWIPYESYN